MGERHQATTDGKRAGGPDDRQNEGHRILDRLQQESAASGSFVRRRADRTVAHLSARDVDSGDRIELWSTRIGRLLGFLVTIAIIIWLMSQLFTH